MQCAWYHKRGIYPEAIKQSRRVKVKQAKGKEAKKTMKLLKQPLKRNSVVIVSKVYIV
jgi:hypothetical protein